jgi:predicted lipoprotein with Yx(FWY)xxD motif
MRAVRTALLALLAALSMAMLGGCTIIAVTGAVVGTGVAVGSAAVKGGVMVGKGAVAVATYPFRDSEEEKEAKRQQELNAEQNK